MCGLAGYLLTRGVESADTMRERVVAMTEPITHRGPDDSGVWVEPNGGIALGHRRLSIIDISPHGHQPMRSASGRYVIAYNGEIYNFPAIRDELEREGGVDWRGHSDTEVMLAALERFGVAQTLERLNGMFAFALWDDAEQTLTLARDRLGKKPLYYALFDGALLFGSELKALTPHPTFRGEIDRSALALYLRHNYVPAPWSIYQGVFKLPAGTSLTLSRGLTALPEPVPYWSAREVFEAGARDPFVGSEKEQNDQLHDLLLDAVETRMVSDVPLGAFLSGGIDSSLVAALMQECSPRPIRTFTIGFHETGYNEAGFAKEVAKIVGTDHTELYVTPEEARSVIPSLPSLYDEPFADSSQIPTFLVSKMAREHVTVCLSGDGGDESFCGYNRYLWAQTIWNRVGWAPAPLRRLMAGSMTLAPPALWNGLYAGVKPLLPARLQMTTPGDKVHKLAEILALSGPVEIYRWLVSQFKHPSAVARGATEAPVILSDPARWAKGIDFSSLMMFLDTVSYLPDDILVKVDRASMGVSLETRAPLLDHRVVAFAARLPLARKMRRGRGKLPLRDILYRFVPEKLIERPKMGFGVPIDQWLRGPLREWAEGLLDEKRIADEGYLDPAPIRRLWREHLSGKRNWQYQLWTILMFQEWLETFHKRVCARSLA